MDHIYKVYRTTLPTAEEMMGEIKLPEQTVPNFDEHKIRCLFGIPESDGVKLVLEHNPQSGYQDSTPKTDTIQCDCCGQFVPLLSTPTIMIQVGLCRSHFHLCFGCMRLIHKQQGKIEDFLSRDGGAIVLVRLLLERIKELGVGTIDKAGGH